MRPLGLLAENPDTAAGVGKSYVSQIEAGKKPGSVAVLKRMATVLRVALDDLAPVED
jgi:transcriptional regulator with XRE-family HTH domain